MKKRGFSRQTLGKKGAEHELYYIIMELLIVVLIAVLMFGFVKNLGTNTFFEKLYMSRDLALVVNTIYAAPGDVQYTYSNDKVNMIKFYFRFNLQKATIDEKEINKEPSSTANYYYYGDVYDEKNPLSNYLIKPKEIKFIKTDNLLKIGNEKLVFKESVKASYPEIYTKNIEWKDEKKIDIAYAADSEQDLAKGLKEEFGESVKNIAVIKESEQKSGNILIVLKVDATSGDGVLELVVQSDKTGNSRNSRKLAGLIKERIERPCEISVNAYINEVKSSSLDQKYNYDVVLAVKLGKNAAGSSQCFYKAIVEGVKNYYEG